jgi:hypothetical protein
MVAIVFPKLVFDEMATPVKEIMGGSSYTCYVR